jgi:hemerythrin-like domain-containing protein
MSEQEREAAIAIIKDEHRSFAAVISGMQYLLGEAQAAGRAPDFRLLRAAIFYIETYTEALHHPKEEAYLFRLLRERTSEFDGELTRLEREHFEEEQTYYELARALRRYQAPTADGAGTFTRALENFAQAAWKHMRFEEEVILPAAARYLTAKDWKEVGEAFFRNGDPRFGRETDMHFRKLFAQIESLVPEGSLSDW